jgi:8-oxo-dGTP diphosphatase
MTETIDSPEREPQMAVGIVAFKDDKVLIVKHGEGSGHINGIYGLPAGRLNEGETLLNAAVREFTEETGLIARPENFSEFKGNVFSAKIPRKNGKIEEFGFTVFKVTGFDGEIRGEDDEVTPMWVSIDDLERIDEEGKLLPNVLAAVRVAKNND